MYVTMINNKLYLDNLLYINKNNLVQQLIAVYCKT